MPRVCTPNKQGLSAQQEKSPFHPLPSPSLGTGSLCLLATTHVNCCRVVAGEAMLKFVERVVVEIEWLEQSRKIQKQQEEEQQKRWQEEEQQRRQEEQKRRQEEQERWREQARKQRMEENRQMGLLIQQQRQWRQQQELQQEQQERQQRQQRYQRQQRQQQQQQQQLQRQQQQQWQQQWQRQRQWQRHRQWQQERPTTPAIVVPCTRKEYSTSGAGGARGSQFPSRRQQMVMWHLPRRRPRSKLLSQGEGVTGTAASAAPTVPAQSGNDRERNTNGTGSPELAGGGNATGLALSPETDEAQGAERVTGFSPTLDKALAERRQVCLALFETSTENQSREIALAGLLHADRSFPVSLHRQRMLRQTMDSRLDFLGTPLGFSLGMDLSSPAKQRTRPTILWCFARAAARLSSRMLDTAITAAGAVSSLDAGQSEAPFARVEGSEEFRRVLQALADADTIPKAWDIALPALLHGQGMILVSAEEQRVFQLRMKSTLDFLTSPLGLSLGMRQPSPAKQRTRPTILRCFAWVAARLSSWMYEPAPTAAGAVSSLDAEQSEAQQNQPAVSVPVAGGEEPSVASTIVVTTAIASNAGSADEDMTTSLRTGGRDASGVSCCAFRFCLIDRVKVTQAWRAVWAMG